MELLSDSPDGTTIVDNLTWTSRATLDAIGEGVDNSSLSSLSCLSARPIAAFDYEFGALAGSDNKLSKSFQNLR
jgi:hypothetical protein